MSTGIIPKTKEQIELMRISALLVSKTLAMLASHISPGVTPLFLDSIADQFIRDHQAIPAFLGLYDFPKTLCISINEQVVHGIPNHRILKEGDIISVDCGVVKNGYYGDHAYTFAVGEISNDVKKLLTVTKQSLLLGIEQYKVGNTIGHVSQTIQTYCEKAGYGVVRELVGHGLGTRLHEKPEVPNFGKAGKGAKIIEGMVIALEPMINMGTKNVVTLKDNWTIVTADGKPSAHYEHDIAIVNGLPDILSDYTEIESVLAKKGSFIA